MNVDAEKVEHAVVGRLILDPRAALLELTAAGVTEAWFQYDSDAAIFHVALALLNRGDVDKVDSFTLFNEVGRFARSEECKLPVQGILDAAYAQSFWQELMDAAPASSAQLPSYIGEFRMAYAQRRVSQIVHEAHEEFEDDWVHALETMFKRVGDLVKKMLGGKSIDKRHVFDEIMDQRRTAYKMKIDPDGPRYADWYPGYNWPWIPFTRFTCGLDAGLWIIAARPSVGKTSFAITLMQYWCEHGIKVLFDCLDMPVKKCLQRFLDLKSRVSHRKAIMFPNREEIAKAEKVAAELADWPLDVQQRKYVEDFITYLTIERQRGNAQIVVIDYLGQLQSREVANDNEYARVSYVSDLLKAAANELEIPIVALCQLNRQSVKDEQREPNLSDLRGSGSIEQDAYGIILLHRDDEVVKRWKESPPTRFATVAGYNEYQRRESVADMDAIWVIFAKQQNGGRGRFPFVVKSKYFLWMRGDEEAQPIIEDNGRAGAANRQLEINTPFFSRVHGDWRHDPYEDVLDANGVLIDRAPIEQERNLFEEGVK